MEAEAHRDSKIWHAGLEPAIQAVLEHKWILVDLDEGLHEAQHCEIRQNTQIFTILPFNGVGLIVESVFLLWDFPDEQEGLTDVLVCTAAVAVD